MDEIQQHDVQFWLYNKVFVEKKDINEALAFAASEAKVDLETAIEYLKKDGRLTKDAQGQWSLPTFAKDEADPEGEYVDIDWMVELLTLKAKYRGQELYHALGIIYKIPESEAREEAAEYGF